MRSAIIKYSGEPINSEITVPGSKSISNRALVLAALADGESALTNLLQCDDTIYMQEALEQLGIKLHSEKEDTTFIEGGLANFAPNPEKPIFVGNAGTAMRFLTATLCLTHNQYQLTGTPRMQERPIGELLSALSMLGCKLLSKNNNGCPPIIIHGNGLQGGEVSFSGKISSQFISALMIAAPYATNDITIKIDEIPVSQPYIIMTAKMMEKFGASVEISDSCQIIKIKSQQQYQPQQYTIESDASSASYFFAAAAVTNGRIKIHNISTDSIQGDIEFIKLLEKMGCSIRTANNWIELTGPKKLRGITADMRDISDTALTMATTALFAEGTTEIKGVANMRFKETDRIAALYKELQKLGAKVTEKEDGLIIEPQKNYKPASIETYDDHRMAMSFAVAGLRIPNLEILDPECTAKTFPTFFTLFQNATGATI